MAYTDLLIHTRFGGFSGACTLSERETEHVRSGDVGCVGRVDGFLENGARGEDALGLLVGRFRVELAVRVGATKNLADGGGQDGMRRREDRHVEYLEESASATVMAFGSLSSSASMSIHHGRPSAREGELRASRGALLRVEHVRLEVTRARTEVDAADAVGELATQANRIARDRVVIGPVRLIGGGDDGRSDERGGVCMTDVIVLAF